MRLLSSQAPCRQLPPSAEIHRPWFLGRYFTDMEDVSFEDDGGDTLTLPTDKSLTEDAEFKKTFDEFQDQVRTKTPEHCRPILRRLLPASARQVL